MNNVEKSQNNNAFTRFGGESLDILLKDDITRKQLLQESTFHEYLTENHKILAELLLSDDGYEKLHKIEIIRQTMEKKQFQDAYEAARVKKFIPSYDLLVYALLNEKLIEVIESDNELNQICLKDASMQCLLSSDVDLKQRILSREIDAVYVLRNENLKDVLLNMNETKCRLERVKRNEGNQPAILPALNYNQTELKIFENDMKRAMYALDRNMYSFKERVNNVTRKLGKGEKLDLDSEILADLKDEDLFSISQKFQRGLNVNHSEESSLNKSNNNVENSFDDPVGICRIFTGPNMKGIKGGDISESSLTDKENVITKDELVALQTRVQAAERETDELITKNRVLQIDYEKEKSKTRKLESILYEKNKELEEGLVTLVEDGKLQLTNSIVESEIKFRSLEVENDALRHDYSATKSELDKICQENTEMFRRVKQFARELMIEKSIVSQLTASRADLESSMNKLAVERDNFKNELINQDEKIGQIELTAREQITNIELEMRKQLRDYEEAVNILKGDNRQLMAEIACTKSESEARSSEMSHTRNLLRASRMEIEDLNRKLEVVTEENIASRNEIEHIMTEFNTKCKQNCNLEEAIEKTKEEKEKLLSNRYALERDVERLGEELKRTKDDIVESARRLGDARNSSLESEKMYQNSQNMIISLQTNLRAAEGQLSAVEDEKKCLHQRVNKLNEQNKFLQKEINHIKQLLAAEEANLKDEKKKSSDMKHELVFLNDTQEKMRNELEILQAALDKEQNLHMSLREQYLLEEKQMSQLQDKIRQYEVQVISLEKRLQEETIQMQQCRAEKERLVEDTRSLYRKLEDYEELLSKEQIKYKQTLDKIRQDFMNDIDYIKREKGISDDTLGSLRDEIVDLKEQIRAKDLQIRGCYQSIGQLDSEAKGRKELECQLMQSEADLRDMEMITKQYKEEAQTEREKQTQLIQQNDKLRMNIVQLKEGLKIVKEEYTKEVFGLNADLQQLSSNSDEEITQLRNSLNKTATDLKATEASLVALNDVGDSLRSTNINYEKTVDALKRRLHQEINNRRLAEQHLEALRLNQGSRHSIHKSMTEDTIRSAGISSAKLEQELLHEKDQAAILKKQLQSVQTSFYTQEAHIQTLELQLAESQGQIATLKRKTETLHGKSSEEPNDLKQLDDLKKHLTLYEKERAIFFQSAQKLAADLEDARSQLISKTKESVQLSEQCKSLREKLTEVEKNNRAFDESIRMEAEKREILEHRNHHLEIQNARMRAITGRQET
ncbi:DgyrCDS6277 [Dimorphilus gyrociliatus]|uniref:DgyrCDS6277 n=1 Tax=Dimorphilus gyrociliatus TaxID=2664684 RepID=A0A7I8VQE1_9ANNE|nr:DgyrCDS6277 [Dimorphilus gyrociliatus]